jgi:hypothetical protein
MTKAQKFKLYFPAWGRAFAANWRREKGRILPIAGRAESEWLARVETCARQLALQAHRAPTSDDLRHGIHVAALGRDKSSAEISGADLDKLIPWIGDGRTIAGVLVDPDDLGSIMALLDPDQRTREWKIATIRQLAPDAMIRHIAADIWHVEDWTKLDLASLEGLRRKLWVRSAPCLPPAPDSGNCPF